VILSATENDAGKRLDHFLQERLPEYSRSRLQNWVKGGQVTVNGSTAKASQLLHGREEVTVEPQNLPPLRAVAEDLPLEILFENESIIVVNKPAGVVVHAGAAHHSGTLTNALVHHFGKLSMVGGELRPGIVHRIDRYTSGVLAVARTDSAHRALAAQFADRTVDKSYLTLVQGVMAAESGRMTTPIARDPVRRTRMTTRLASGRSALTMWRALRRFQKFTYLEVKIGTGRTHQIRAHLASVGHPVAGDKLYGAAPSSHGRYFLHAASLALTDPETGERVTVSAPLPDDLEEWLNEIR
jgi:23S rRNA pseudouridine1911/1915/1917 synthase